MSENETEFVFDQVQIGKGLKPLAQHGHVVIDTDRGMLTLLGSNRETIVSAPLSSVSAAKVRFTRGQTLSLTLSGEKYNVSPGWGEKVGTFVLPGDAKPVKNAAEMLLRLIERGGGTSS